MITTQDIKIQYSPTTPTTEFPFNIPYFDETDVNVEVVTGESTNILILNALSNGFSIKAVKGDPTNGGTVTLTESITEGNVATMYRSLYITQEAEFQRGGDLPPEVLNIALDRGIAISQEIEELNLRQLSLPVTDPEGLNYELPVVELRKGKVVGFDAIDGSAVVIDLGTSGTIGVDTDKGLSMTSNIVSVKIDDDTINFDAEGNVSVKTIGADELRDNIVSTATLQSDSVTYDKMQDVTANLKVLGNVNGGGTVEEVYIDDNLSSVSTSHDTLATALCIKEYVDAQVDDSETAGYNPTTYSGEESVQLPNGLIMKWGSKNGSGTVTFSTPFPNSCVSAQVTVGPTSSGSGVESTIQSKSNTALVLWNNAGYHPMMWTAIGF